MREIIGQLWDFYGKLNTVVCITTNGTVRQDGAAVMGRGCALEASERFPEFRMALGHHIKRNGNVPMRLEGEMLITFPVKHNWFEAADLALIQKSAQWLAGCDPAYTYVLPRPGCGNGRLQWRDVHPLIEFLPDNVWVISKER